MTEKVAPESGNELASGRRFVLVDALRGIAALAVLFHHLLFSSDLQITLWQVLPNWFAEFCHRGAFGVEIFFVLSGFVIAHSLRNVPLSLRSVGNFMLRRQIRLDPPYWTVLFAALLLLFVEAHVPWIERKPLPSFLDVVINLCYLQVITGTSPIISVSWTLCMEVQFYLVFILLLLAGKSLGRSGAKSRTLSAILVALLAIGSLLVPAHQYDHWFIQWWYYFAAGALGYWSVGNPRFRAAFIGFLIFFFVVAVRQEEPGPLLIGWTTALLLYTAGCLGTLTRWLDFAPLQYLGRISYSLYLIHLLVVIYVLRLGYRLTGTNHAGAVFWFFLAGAISIVAAHGLYLLVEARSVRFAARLKPARKAAPASVPLRGPGLSDGVEELQNA
jgi:peptidoglycan/LPS O-acetylase OafA/YrhL